MTCSWGLTSSHVGFPWLFGFDVFDFYGLQVVGMKFNKVSFEDYMNWILAFGPASF